jgi:hypothetical protein
MGNRRRWLLAAFAVSTALGGCAHRATCPAPADPQTTLPNTQRTNVEANIRSLPRADATSLEPLPAPAYRALTPVECQCLAVNAAPGASLHTQEAEVAERGPHQLFKGDAGPTLRRDVLVYTALEMQNRTAGAALELYYRIAEAEGKSELVDLALGQLNEAVNETRRITTRGLKPPVDLDVWQRQLSTSQADRLQAQMTIDQLNGQLKGLLRLSDCERWRVWNPEGYEVIDFTIDVEAMVCDGLARRPELLMLRLLARDLTPATLPAVRDAIRAIHPLLGAATGCPLVAAKLPALLALDLAARKELDVRRRQVEEYLHERESAVAEEIRQAAEALRYRTRIVALAKERERSWQERVRDARSRQQQGLTSFAEVAQTNLEWLKARADVVQEVMAWEIARVKLKQAQGLLVAECVCSQSGPTAGLGTPHPAR